MEHKIELPLVPTVIESLRIFDTVRLSGLMLVARDQAHKRLTRMILARETLPVDIAGQLIYYMGPASKPPEMIIGSCGPTTASRMDPYTPLLMKCGVAAMMGKGPRSKEVTDAIREHKGLYLAAFGGCGALYASKVVSFETVAFHDLGPEALLLLKVEDFPAIVAIDSLGNTIFS